MLITITLALLITFSFTARSTAQETKVSAGMIHTEFDAEIRRTWPAFHLAGVTVDGLFVAARYSRQVSLGYNGNFMAPWLQAHIAYHANTELLAASWGLGLVFPDYFIISGRAASAAPFEDEHAFYMSAFLQAGVPIDQDSILGVHYSTTTNREGKTFSPGLIATNREGPGMYTNLFILGDWLQLTYEATWVGPETNEYHELRSSLHHAGGVVIVF